jgi:hypothetical protein
MAEYENRDGQIVETRRSSSTGWLLAIVVIIGLVVAAFALGLVNIDQTQTAKLPDVKVETSGGQAPAFDVDTATVDVGTKETTVEVPTVDVEPAK